MGSGIAQVAASNGCKVNLVDTFPNALKNSQTKLKSILNRLIEKGKIDENEAKSILDNINWTVKLAEVSQSDLVVEAIVENMEIKQKLFSQMESLVA